MSEQIEWIPLPMILRMKVEGGFTTDYPMIAWRYDHKKRRIQYLGLDGFIWPGKYGATKIGVVGLAEGK